MRNYNRKNNRYKSLTSDCSLALLNSIPAQLLQKKRGQGQFNYYFLYIFSKISSAAVILKKTLGEVRMKVTLTSNSLTQCITKSCADLCLIHQVPLPCFEQ